MIKQTVNYFNKVLHLLSVVALTGCVKDPESYQKDAGDTKVHSAKIRLLNILRRNNMTIKSYIKDINLSVMFGLIFLCWNCMILTGVLLAGIEWAFTDISYNRFIHWLDHNNKNYFKLFYISIILCTGLWLYKFLLKR